MSTSTVLEGGAPAFPNALACSVEGYLAALQDRGAHVFLAGASLCTSKWVRVVGWRPAAEGNSKGGSNDGSDAAQLLPWSLTAAAQRQQSIQSSLLAWSP